MKNDSNALAKSILILIALAIFGLISAIFDSDDKEEKTEINGGYHSSYWYDSKETRKKKADDTLNKYYERDENGNLTRKEGTIVNGKPYHKN